jgi:hypothetical protein
MKTLKLSAGIIVLFLLAGWRLRAAIGDLDPQIYDWICQYAPQLVMWVKVDLVVMGVGFVIVAAYAAMNEMELAREISRSYSDMKEHFETELTSSITRSVRAECREMKESLDARNLELEQAESDVQDRQEALACRERLVANREDAAKTLYEGIVPLKRSYEDEKGVLESYVAVTKEDSEETLKILDKVLSWVQLAMGDPQNFISAVKADRVNIGWVERLQRKLQSIDERAEATKHETEQIQERVAGSERRQSRIRAEMKL